MIIYGYAFDTDDLHKAERRVLEAHDLYEGCYSTGAGKITAAVFGVELDGSGFLFNPVALSSLNTVPTEAQKEHLSHQWAALPESIRKAAKNQTPEVFAFDTSDD
jgi:hypothetical protein